MVLMKKETLRTILNSIVSVATAISADLVESIEERAELSEEKSRMEWLRSEWFTRFHNLPCSYMVETWKNESHSINRMVYEGILVCKKGDEEATFVAIPYRNKQGDKRLLLKDIYGDDDDVAVEQYVPLYKGSIENCWLRWYTFEKENLG